MQHVMACCPQLQDVPVGRQRIGRNTLSSVPKAHLHRGFVFTLLRFLIRAVEMP